VDSRFVGKREPRFDLDYAYGLDREEYVAGIAADLATARVEVKASPFLHTNLYVEYECRHADGVWRPSGIAVTEAETTAWCIGDLMIAAPTEAWKQVCRRAWPQYMTEAPHGSHPTRGLSIPLLGVLLPQLLNECRLEAA
jgi:hypothetical protein